MSVILILILASLAMALLFLGSFFWAVRSGQFEDTYTPSMRVLTDDARTQFSKQSINNADQPAASSASAHSRDSETKNKTTL